MKKRIKGEQIDIDYKDTLNFFEHRGTNKTLGNKYNYVLFQDDNPELALQRDYEEKEKICTLLTWKPDEFVLDIGCGIGRWGEEILKKGLYYVGIDYSEHLLKIASENLKDYIGKFQLIHGNFQKFPDKLAETDAPDCFDKIFINGVCMYLNDDDLVLGLEHIGKVSGNTCEIYLKETVTLEERLTLNQFYSESLTQSYTAIYRSIEEYRNLLIQKLVEPYGFEITKEEFLFESTLRNRKETTDYYFILKRRKGNE